MEKDHGSPILFLLIVKAVSWEENFKAMSYPHTIESIFSINITVETTGPTELSVQILSNKSKKQKQFLRDPNNKSLKVVSDGYVYDTKDGNYLTHLEHYSYFFDLLTRKTKGYYLDGSYSEYLS